MIYLKQLWHNVRKNHQALVLKMPDGRRPLWCKDCMNAFHREHSGQPRVRVAFDPSPDNPWRTTGQPDGFTSEPMR